MSAGFSGRREDPISIAIQAKVDLDSATGILAQAIADSVKDARQAGQATVPLAALGGLVDRFTEAQIALRVAKERAMNGRRW